MTARPIFSESRRRPVCIAVAQVLMMVAVLLAAGCVSMAERATITDTITESPTTIVPLTTAILIASIPVTPSDTITILTPSTTEEPASDTAPLFEITGSTIVLAHGTDSAAKAAANGYPPIKRIIPSVARFDLVTFNHTAINEKLKSGQKIPVRFRGKDRMMNLTRMTFENTDDGIDSYHGTLDGEKWSEVLLTTSPQGLIGRVTITDDEIQIVTAVNEDNTVNAISPVHYIYSSKDIQDRRFVIDRGTATIAESRE